MVKLEFNGVQYKNVVEMSKELPMMTSVLIGYTEGAEVLCSNAAAICYDSDVSHENNEPNKLGKAIIKHCLESGHNTVLEHGIATFVKKVPIFVARQDLRSRIASFNERSLRYCRASDGSLTYYVPDYLSPENIDRLEKAGRHVEADSLQEMLMDWIDTHEKAIEIYSKYSDEELDSIFQSIGLDGERVRETIRAALPLGINTFYIDTRNLWSWVHHSRKRLCLRAQKEIRLIREQEIKQLRKVFPNIFNYVDKPCYMGGCIESKPCGIIKLDQNKKAML